MQIDKIIIIDSPVHLWNILRAKDENLDQCSDEIFIYLNHFSYYVDEYINGCKCNEDENYADMMNQYLLIQENNDVISHLIKCFECDKIEFK